MCKEFEKQMAINDEGLKRGIVESAKHGATRADARAFIYIMCSKLEANDLRTITAAKPESQYIRVEKDALA